MANLRIIINKKNLDFESDKIFSNEYYYEY